MSLDSWTKSLESGSPVDVVYLDFSRAFDRVPLRRPISKLNHIGICGGLLQWIKSLSSNREFSVRVDASSSRNETETSGVPQCSVLETSLFLVYVADLQLLVSCACSAYADDLKLFADAFSSSMQGDLHRISEWCRECIHPLNIEKCKVLY